MYDGEHRGFLSRTLHAETNHAQRVRRRGHTKGAMAFLASPLVTSSSRCTSPLFAGIEKIGGVAGLFPSGAKVIGIDTLW